MPPRMPRLAGTYLRGHMDTKKRIPKAKSTVANAKPPGLGSESCPKGQSVRALATSMALMSGGSIDIGPMGSSLVIGAGACP